MVSQNHSPATKQDITLLMEQMGTYYEKTHREMVEWKKEIIHEFHVVAEDIKHDFKGAFKGKLEQHDDRILCLEQHVGLAA